METIVLSIVETGRSTLKDKPEAFNTIWEEFKNENELRAYLELRYGKVVHTKNKLYRDKKDEAGNITETVEVGFTYSFWNQDVSHMSKKWYQTDWIEFWKETRCKEYFTLK